jgi:hypothetical protein
LFGSKFVSDLFHSCWGQSWCFCVNSQYSSYGWLYNHLLYIMSCAIKQNCVYIVTFGYLQFPSSVTVVMLCVRPCKLVREWCSEHDGCHGIRLTLLQYWWSTVVGGLQGRLCWKKKGKHLDLVSFMLRYLLSPVQINAHQTWTAFSKFKDF